MPAAATVHRENPQPFRLADGVSRSIYRRVRPVSDGVHVQTSDARLSVHVIGDDNADEHRQATQPGVVIDPVPKTVAYTWRIRLERQFWLPLGNSPDQRRQ